MVASDSFAEFLREQLAPLGRVTMRRMFGKTGVFCDGLMFGMVTNDTLYFRVDDHNRAVFKEAESVPPLSYEKKGSTIDLSFWRAPERLLDEPDELLSWARSALLAARRVALKRERTAPGRKIQLTEISRIQQLINAAAQDGTAPIRCVMPFWVVLPDYTHCLWTLPQRDVNFPVGGG